MRAWLMLMVMAIGACVNANLEIITYQPIVLNLTFSQPITLPKFQLLYNEIPTSYQVRQPNNTAQNCFIIDVDQQKLPVSNYLTEKYVVMFTQPLEIAGGQLNLNSFSIRAHRARNNSDYMLVPISEKKSLYPYQNFTEQTNIQAIVICVLVYIIAYTTVIGLSGYNFLVVIVYISLKTQMFTSLDYKVAFYFLFDVHQAQNYSSMFQILYLLIPHIFIAFGFVVGLIIRYTLQKHANRNIFWNYIYYYFAYRVAIITWQMVSVPIFINTVHMIEQFNYNQSFYTLKIVIVYFNFLIILGFAYFAYFKSNPQVGEPLQSWISYSQTWHSQLYNGFHLGTDPKNFAKRNCKLVIYSLNMLTLLFVSVSSSQVPNIIIQLIFLLYFFVVRPFKYNFFNYFFLYMKSCIILFYLYRYIVDLYIGINEDIITGNGMTNILLANIILVSLIVAAYCILAIYELYQRVRVFKINHRMWGMSKYQEPEGEVRRTKKSMFEIEKQQQQKRNIESKSIMPLSSRNRRINFEDIDVNKKQIGIPKSPDKKKQRQKRSPQKGSPQKGSPQKKSPQKGSPQKGSPYRKRSQKLKKSKSNESSQGKSPKQKKQIKQKQSLLKSISLEAQSPRYQ